MTYPAHVILRFRLEQALIAGDLAIADLPGAWNDGMRALLGIVPPDDARGCLQDIHWYDGAFGYFPSYTLGAMAAAQLMAAARRAVPGLDGRAGPRRPVAADGLAARPRCTAGAACSASTTCCARPPASRSTRPISRRI